MHQIFSVRNFFTRIAPVLAAATLALAASQSAQADVITFDGATIGAPISQHSEAGFSVNFSAAPWFVSGYGNGGSSIQFRQPDGPSLTGLLNVARGGSLFRFNSLDLYSSITIIPYAISGFRNGSEVFSFEGVVPNTFGNFATVPSQFDNLLIDSLSISVTNPSIGFGGNPVGVDNINLLPVPEPESYAMMAAGLAALVWRRRRQA